MKICFSPPDITEEEIKAVEKTMRSGWITTGPQTKKFETEIAKYLGTSNAVCLNSATAALEMTLHVLGISTDDEIITSAYTYTASASPVIHIGAKLVLVDTEIESYEMDYEKLADSITEKTKVIIPVDIAGVPCDYNKIFEIVNAKKNIFKPNNELQEAIGRIIILADSAHAFGANWHGEMVGKIADFSSFSFHAVKNLTTAEGGCITWKDISGIDNEKLYKQYQLLSLHGQNKDALEKTKIGAWEYDIKDCYYKCNMTDIMATIGLIQLKRYNSLLGRRRKIISMYDEAFSNLNVQVLNHYDDNHNSSGHLYLVRLLNKDRRYTNKIIEKMSEAGIATNVHYKPLPMHTAYKKRGFDINEYPNAYKQFENEITLPLHTKLTDEEVKYIIQNFRGLVQC